MIAPVPEASFDVVLRALLVDRGWSFRTLAQATQEHDPADRGISHGHLVRLGRPEPLTVTAIELVARALDIEPNAFAEYRLALARRLFDERHVGLAMALENLELLTEQASRVPPLPERLSRLAREAGAAHHRPARQSGARRT